MDNVVLKISSKSNPSKVAGAIVNMLGENEKVELNAIGAGAVNQAAKSINSNSKRLHSTKWKKSYMHTSIYNNEH